MENFDIGNVADRPDRLVEISVPRDSPVTVELSIDGGNSWSPATIYPGRTVDQWRARDADSWNRGVMRGAVPTGSNICLWNYFFDLVLPRDSARLRLRNAQGDRTLFDATVDLRPIRDVFVIDHRNAAALAGGRLPGNWRLKPSELDATAPPSLFLKIDKEVIPFPGQEEYKWWRILNPNEARLVLKPGLRGWHRVYVGAEPFTSLRLYFPRDDLWYDLCNFAYPTSPPAGEPPPRYRQELLAGCFDLTDQDLHVTAGGARYWHDVSIRYIRFVPMTPDEVAEFNRVRSLAEQKRRPFAGYVEPVTFCAYDPMSFTLRDYMRNEMRINRLQGCTDVYVHVVRIGSKAQYHSDVTERYDPTDDEIRRYPWLLHYKKWMEEGDPLAVAVEEAHAAAMMIFADAGMNSTYVGSAEHYTVETARFAREHPELLCPEWTCLFDYRKAPVRDYLVGIIRELMAAYDVDGVHLDFSRWGFPKAYDVESLVTVLRRIHQARLETQRDRGRPLVISARVDHKLQRKADQEPEVFLEALRIWAKEGLVDRVMPNVDGVPLEQIDLSHYAQAVNGTATQLWLDLYQGTWWMDKGGPARDLALARSWVAQGVTGGLFYYMAGRPAGWENINWQLRLIDYPEIIVDPNFRES